MLKNYLILKKITHIKLLGAKDKVKLIKRMQAKLLNIPEPLFKENVEQLQHYLIESVNKALYLPLLARLFYGNMSINFAVVSNIKS